MAQDRLVQLELFRRATQGRLSEVLGESRLNDDIVARRDYYTLPELRRMLNRLPPPLRARFDAYAEGVNLWLAQTAGRSLAAPAGVRAAQPDARAVARGRLGLGRRPARAHDPERRRSRARELEGAAQARRQALQPLPAAALEPTRSRPSPPPRAASRPTPGRTRKDERAGFKRSQRFLKGLRAPKATAGSAALIRGGSNAWAVRGSGNHAYLFHGPQLGFQIPEQLAELEVHRPGLDARGVTPPGLPLVGIGRNDHIAWGLTSGLTDDDDLYAERLAGKERYRFKGKVRRMKCRTETFKVAGERDVKRRLCRTVHGPVQASSRGTAWARRYATWQHEMDTLVGLAELNEADTVQQAGRALNKVSWNENTMLADDQGNIAWYHPGRLPIRPKRWDERLPLPGTGNAEWRGFLKPSQRPHVVNPDQGWLANWNNMPSVGWTVGDAPATERISGRLHRAAYLSGLVANAKSYDAVKAVDRSAGTTAQQRPLLEDQLREAANGATGGAKTVLDTILAWDGNYDRTDAAGTVDPGVAAWEALKDEAVDLLPAAVDDWLGGVGRSHAFDFSGADGVAFRDLTPAGLRRAAANAATALGDPSTWRKPRQMYDVTVLGVADEARFEVL